ncbi:MAG TPA: hypothetical protein VK837_12490 [Longimicrobiales bacterium]|nr:hypothetical protein [Longimicrobiales bacterium]
MKPIARIASAVLLLAAVGAPPGVSAQRAVSDSLAHADSIRHRALRLQADPETFYQAAIAYKDAALYRRSTDVTAIGDLILAGHLLNAAGQQDEAMETLEEAAERARSLGDIERAAQAYLDAAFVAEALEDDDAVQRLGTNAEMLAASPLLSDPQREHILRRLRRARSGEALAVNVARADSLHDEALRGQAERALRLADALRAQGEWEAVGRLFVEEAELRPAADPSAVDLMIVAANLFYAADLPMRAREVLEAAGDRAEASGDLVRAARAYLDAATIAEGEGHEGAVRDLVERAKGLTESPLLSEEQKERIRQRITRLSARLER